MKKYFLFSLIALLFIVSFPLNAAMVQLVAIGDTTDEKLGHTMDLDVQMVYAEAAKIAQNLDLPLRTTQLKGLLVTPQNVINTLNSLTIDPDDIVILYCNLHGYRTVYKETRWPILFFGLRGQGVEFDTLINILASKNPRFLLAMAESCNKVMKNAPPVYRQQAFATGTELVKINYKKLFMEQSGTIIISTSSPDEYAWAWVNEGALFTMSFIEMLKTVTNSQNEPKWDDLIEKAKEKTQQMVLDNELDSFQTPQYEINLRPSN
jgi:hypothetical protein